MLKKHLGQHFLHDVKLLNKIVAESPAQSGDLVLEIGPGDGALTRSMLDRGYRVVAVEYDAELIPVLSEKFAAEVVSGQFMLHQGDILEFSFETLNLKLETRDYHIIANIPYYITGAILRKFLSGQHQPQSMTLIMQREVADRIMAYGNKHSLLSLSVQAYGMVTRPFIISRGSFNPPPEVDSAVLVVNHISRIKFENQKHEDRFFEIIHAGFSQKRKQLKGLLPSSISPEQFRDWCAAHAYPVSIRAEDVSLAAWVDLARPVVFAQ